MLTCILAESRLRQCLGSDLVHVAANSLELAAVLAALDMVVRGDHAVLGDGVATAQAVLVGVLAFHDEADTVAADHLEFCTGFREGLVLAHGGHGEFAECEGAGSDEIGIVVDDATDGIDGQVFRQAGFERFGLLSADAGLGIEFEIGFDLLGHVLNDGTDFVFGLTHLVKLP